MEPQKNNWNNWNWNARLYIYSSKKQIYNHLRFSKPTTPSMPTLGKDTKFGKIRLSQVQKGMYYPLVPMIFPVSMNMKRF